MTVMNLVDSFLRGEYPLVQSALLVMLFLIFLFLFRRSFIKDMIEKAGLATKDDIKQLQGDMRHLEERLDGKMISFILIKQSSYPQNILQTGSLSYLSG